MGRKVVGASGYLSIYLFVHRSIYLSIHLSAKRHLNVKPCSNPVQSFYTFDLEMCFAPRRRPLFQHLSFQKWPEHVVLLRAFIRSHKSLGKQCFAAFLPFRAPASSFFWHLLTLSSLICFLLTFSSLVWFFLPFSSLTFSSDSSHLRVSSVHLVGSLTSKISKLPSIIQSVAFCNITLYGSEWITWH